MAHSKSRSRLWARPLLTALVAAWLAMPSLTACAEDGTVAADDPIPLGEAAEPRPTLTLNLADTETGIETVRTALRRTALDIRLVDVTVEGASVTGFRVFFNATDARAETPVDDPAYVASFSFFPAPSVGSPAGTFVIDLEPALTRLAVREDVRLDDLVTLTLVPIGTEDARIGLGSSEIVE